MKTKTKKLDENDLKGRISNLELIVFKLQQQIDILIQLAGSKLVGQQEK